MPPKAAKTKKAPKKAPGKAKAPAKSGSAVTSKQPNPDRKVNTRRSVDATGSWPIDAETGEPMVQISVTASELIPTGEYANVIVGPVTATKFIPDPGDGLADEINDLAETIEADVISVQRTLVLESLQDSVE